MRTQATPERWPSAEEIRRYHEGSLDASRAHQIELLALESPLLAEALEGYAEIPAFGQVPAAPEKFQVQSSPWWHLAGWGIGIVIGGALGYLVFLSGKTELSEPMTGQLIDNGPRIEQHELAAAVEEGKRDTAMVQENEEARPSSRVPTSNPVGTSGQTAADSLGSLDTDEGFSYVVIKDHPVLEPPIWKLDEATADAELQPARSLPHDILHIRNHHLVDYTALRKPAWPGLTVDELGLSAAYESAERREEEADDRTSRAVPYITYIEQCIELFAQREYRKALDRFNVVLDHYPDDVNALFYSGMCNVKLGRHEQAIRCFDLVRSNVFDVFNEEADYYTAKSWLALGSSEEAKKIFRRIVDEGGFYAAQAEEEIRRIEGRRQEP